MPSIKTVDSHQKESGAEMHNKLQSIIERFEETRMAIRENVKLLEAMQDTTSTLDSVYPMDKRKGSTSMDMANGTGTSFGLRTISSIDSGVMLTMTSCSDMGLQSMSRSFDSWNDTTSPYTLRDYNSDVDDRSECGKNDIGLGDKPKLSFSNYSMGEVFDDEEENSEGIHILQKNHENRPLKIQRQLSMISPSSTIGPSATITSGGCEEWYESQEEEFSFEEEFPSQKSDSPNIKSASSNVTQSESGAARIAVRPEHCMVLPALETRMKSNRPQSLILSNKDLRDCPDMWMDKDHVHVSKDNKDARLPRRDSFAPSEKSFQQSFSPIPEESSSDQTPSTPHRPIKSSSVSNNIHHKAVHEHGNRLEDSQPFMKKFLNLHEKLRAVSSTSTEESVLEKRRIRRKKKNITPRILSTHENTIASTTASSSSTPSQNSDSSYHNAIRNFGLKMPQDGIILRPKMFNHEYMDNVSCSNSSASYFDNVYTTSSSSSDETSDHCISHYANHNLKTKLSECSNERKILSLFRKNSNGPTKSQPPVIKRLSKDSLILKESPPVQGSQNARLFTKNQESNKKLNLKSKSDEASNSLLRYFSFPSPPKTIEEGSEQESNKETVSTHKPNIQKEEKIMDTRKIELSRRCNNTCSCCLSSSDTASEIAYPDQQHKPLARLSTEPNNQVLDSKASSTENQEKNIPAHQGVEPQEVPPQVQPAVSYNNYVPQPGFKGYTVSIHEPAEKVKKPKRSLLDILFRRKKLEKPVKSDSSTQAKLMLDLAGGEVRVKPQPMLKDLRLEIPYQNSPGVSKQTKPVYYTPVRLDPRHALSVYTDDMHPVVVKNSSSDSIYSRPFKPIPTVPSFIPGKRLITTPPVYYDRRPLESVYSRRRVPIEPVYVEQRLPPPSHYQGHGYRYYVPPKLQKPVMPYYNRKPEVSYLSPRYKEAICVPQKSVQPISRYKDKHIL